MGDTMSGMNGDYLSLAEACGEVEHHRGWVAGEDFDPSDEYEMDVMELVWENERFESMRKLEAENARLRARLAELEGDDDGQPYEDAYFD